MLFKRKNKKYMLCTPVRPCKSCDGLYFYCPRCGFYDIKKQENKCPRCELMLNWTNI